MSDVLVLSPVDVFTAFQGHEVRKLDALRTDECKIRVKRAGLHLRRA